MAEHERSTQGKNEKVDQKHRTRQQESQPSSNTLHEWNQGLLPSTETPFHPRMDEHTAILSNIPFSAQRQEFIMGLHQTYGNRYVQRLMESMKMQAKLTVNAPNDVYEQEADRVADTVTRAIQTPVSRQEEEMQMKPVLQRQEEEEEVQMQPVENQHSMASNDIETRINDARGNGQTLSGSVKEPLEKAFGADFGDVRIHTDSEANNLNQELSAKAFTTRQDIFFREGEYSPGSDSGRKLIAHELTHVVQQSTGRNRGSVSGMMMQQPAVAELGMANVVWRALQDDIQPDEIKANHPGLLTGDGSKEPLAIQNVGDISCWLGLALALTATKDDSTQEVRLGVIGAKMEEAQSYGGWVTSGEKFSPGAIMSWGEKGTGHVGVVAQDGEMIAGYNQSAYINGGKASGYYNVGTVKKSKKGKKAGQKIRQIR